MNPATPNGSYGTGGDDSKASGCGCNATGTGGTMGWLLGLGALVLRRR